MRFEKVSYEQYKNNVGGDAKEEWGSLKIPKRATKYSAGYDFYAPHDLELAPGESIKIPTGIRVILEEDKFLAIYPRSGLGFKYRVSLYNTCGIVDADYSNSDNEGHIFIKLYNGSPEGKTMKVKQGEAFAQGIIQSYYMVDEDETDGIRNGGFGSTNI